MAFSQRDLFRWADQLPAESWNDLDKRPPQQAAEAVGAQWDGQSFKVPLLGVLYSIDPVNRRIEKAGDSGVQVSYQVGFVLLTSVTISKGVPPSGRMVVPQELPGGRMFFTGAHALATEPLAKRFEKASDLLINRAIEIGGERIEGADIGIRLPGLPYVPLTILFWQGNEEIPARAVIGIDDRAHFHLDLAGVLALTNILVFEFCRVE